MQTCRSKLGNYLWNQRSNRGIKRAKLARMIDCERESIVILEDRGQDDEGILSKLIEPLELDAKVVDDLQAEDKLLRLEWLKLCGWALPPVIVAAHQPLGCTVKIPARVVRAGNEAVEQHALDVAKKWNRTIELFMRSHIRFVVKPNGEVDITELGFFEPEWLESD